jgi:TRAP-type C4-dicarboxylate transport system permease small subunit
MHLLAQGFAMAGGIAIGILVLITLSSVLGRILFQSPIPGDIEIAQLLMAFAISCFLPWCQTHRSHVAVEFFTQRCSRRAQQSLHSIGDLLMGLIASLLAWRTAMAALSAFSTNEGSMILGIPVWVNYAVLVPGFLLMGLIAFWRVIKVRHG